MRINLPSLALGIIVMFLVHANLSKAQTIPFEFKNTSPFNDNDLYVAIVGIDMNGAHVWIDCKTSTMLPMSPAYNTVTGPSYGGNNGPGNNARYANCFAKLSDVPGKTVQLPKIQGCRAFIAKGSQLYFYFFGSTGAPSGYSSPNATDPTDPNTGIMYEIIELTYNQYGFWGNTTRVDSYHYAMGMELYGAGNTFINTGELKTHAQIGAAFQAAVPVEFQGCYDASSGAIHFPTKTAAFADGSVGTMPTVGPYVNYMKPYIDAIWAKYANEDLIFDAGDAGVWKGRVIGEQLIMTAQTGGFIGRKGIIDRRPTTQEAFEGKGVLDRVIQDAPTDLMIQAQICAAITRHVINTTTPNVGLQTFSDPSKYYLTAPCNYYAKFWHQQGISVNNKSYAFAYDDVFDQSSTLYSGSPIKVIVIFGGYGTSTPPVESPYSGTRIAIPGTVQAENYDLGGEGLAYHDLTSGNSGGAYRTDNVDVEQISAGNFNVGYIQNGEWMKYMVNVTTAGKYTIDAVVAATAAGKTFTVEADGTSIATFTIPNTGAWTTFQTVTISNVNLSAGNKIIRILATSDDFNIDKLIFTLVPNVAPTVSITAPNTNSTYIAPATINFTAVAADTDGSITKVEFYNGTAKLGEDVSSPYTYNWAGVNAGTYTITAKATDNLGLITTSTAITVMVNNNQLPVVAITSPSVNNTFLAPASIHFTATALDSDGSITKVEFYNGSTKIGEDVSSPYEYTWTPVASGTYTITAKATDNLGGITTSSGVMVLVSPSAVTSVIGVDADEIILYPNPAITHLNIEAVQNLNGATITITNAMGQTVYTGSAMSVIEVSGLEAGVYYFNLIKEGKKISKKFVKQ